MRVNKIICDRCGVEISAPHIMINVREGINLDDPFVKHSTERNLELCDDCREDFYVFLKEKKI